MADGLWPAVSGAIARQRSVEVVSNNLANTDTPAFKKDVPTFKEYLSVLEREPAHLDIPQGPVRDRDFYPLDGRDQSFVVNDATYTDFKQGPLKVTHSTMDFAINGPGFFEVSTPYGVRYTKQGSFKLATDGRLVTAQGFPVLSSQPGGLATAQPVTAVQPNQGGLQTQGGVAAGQVVEPPPEVVARYIDLSDAKGQVTVNEKGEIYSGDQKLGELSVVEFQDTRKLRKDASQVFLNPDPQNYSTTPVTTKVHQGMVEASNVNPAEEMTKLISAHRSYEAGMKNMKVYDELMEKEANNIGKQ